MEVERNDRTVHLLETVAEGGGEHDARVIDLLVSARFGPSETTVRSELRALAAEGLLELDESRGVGGTWALTAAGREILDEASTA